MVSLVGDGIENPANATALTEAAEMFAVPCRFRDSRDLASHLPGLSTVDTAGLLATPIVAVDNAPGAESVYNIRRVHDGASIVVGNERRGIRPDLLRAAAHTVQIPMPGRGVNTLNVATAAAVALYYLGGATGRRPARRSSRPGVLLAAPRDHVEAGSSLRSAAAFGWSAVAVEDRDKVWFGTPRPLRAESRAAARSHRNPLRVFPSEGPDPVYSRIVVCSPTSDGPPVHRTDLTGTGTLVVIPDEGWEPPPSRAVEWARVDVPGVPGRYRLVTGIVLAEVARQLGEPAKARPPRRGLSYGSELDLAAPDGGELLFPWELGQY
ncbi:TrmH family RNA methyltransferase [Dactylosporangium sp. CS-047395]|uniref:TrmH family RNA methyltransferase n=1 Tax=Dactylosporangium sp. CS-047395 TaxID=3239936 RepID=UPI003D950302